jgi:RNA-binding protein YhbY
LGSIAKIQLGKNGITENFILTLKSHFENHVNVKVVVLRNFCRDKKQLNEIEAKILDKLGKNYTAKSIGYTIAIKKWRKDVR